MSSRRGCIRSFGGPARHGVWPARGCLLGLALVGVVLGAGCRNDMHDAPRYDPLEASDFFPDGQAARRPPANTVARGLLMEDTWFHTGKVNNQFVSQFPFPVTLEVLQRGQQRYNIFCQPCHDMTGSGNGMIVRRGFRPPPSLHIDRLREAPVGYFYDVITNGFGAMYGYAERIPPKDRWAIVSYIRALQLSQNASVDDIPADEPIRRQVMEQQ